MKHATVLSKSNLTLYRTIPQVQSLIPHPSVPYPLTVEAVPYPVKSHKDFKFKLYFSNELQVMCTCKAKIID